MLIESVLIIVLALLLDALIGEFRCCHPLVAFGKLANFVERKLNKPGTSYLKLKGVMGVVILILPLITMLALLQAISEVLLLNVFVLYLTIGRKSLHQHALNVFLPLNQNRLQAARKNIGFIVSRDTADLNKQQVTTACIESVIENSNDAIYGAIFWFVILGAPGALMYRLANTLDAMWGYKNSRFLSFGWAAAKFDDVLNWLPARLTVLSFAVLSRFTEVWNLAFKQGMQCSSKNAGPVMAAGACALKIKLGGLAYYHGEKICKPELGCGHEAQPDDIKRALKLTDKVLVLWVFALVLISFLMEMV